MAEINFGYGDYNNDNRNNHHHHINQFYAVRRAAFGTPTHTRKRLRRKRGHSMPVPGGYRNENDDVGIRIIIGRKL